MNLGQVAQLTATVADANGNAVSTETVSFSSSAPNIISVSPAGALCGGAWDSTYIHCNPGPVGSATISAKASPSGINSNGASVYVHYKADSIVVGESFPVAVPLSCGVPVATAAGCISSGATVPNNTERFTAMACSNDPLICAPNAPPCPLDPNTLGPFTFAAANATIAAAAPDVTDPNNVAVVTALGPGQTQITASLASTTSLAAPFVSCGPKSITIHVPSQPATTTLSVAKGTTSALQADVVDTNGNPLPSFGLAWSSSVPAAASVSTTGTVSGLAPGTTNVVASCAPPGCNAGTQQSIYSNVVQATVPGTVNAATVYATSSDAGTTTIVPISTSTNTAGTAIPLPSGFSPPNSFLFAPNGLKAYLGSDSGLIVLDPVAGTTSSLTSISGKVLAISNDGVRVAVAGPVSSNTLYLYDTVTGGIQTLNVPVAVAADFTPDHNLLFAAAIGSGNRLYESGTGVFANFGLSGTPASVALLASGAFAYVGDPATDVFSTCSNSPVGNVGLASTLIKAAAKPVPAPNNLDLQLIAVTGNQITQIDAVPGALGSPCPNVPTNTAQAYSFPGVAAFTPVQLFVTPDSARAIVTASDANQLLVYQIGTNAGSGSAYTIPLAHGATGTYTGGAMVDSGTVWVGVAGVNEVHQYSLGSNALSAAVPLSFSPKLVAVRYQ